MPWPDTGPCCNPPCAPAGSSVGTTDCMGLGRQLGKTSCMQGAAAGARQFQSRGRSMQASVPWPGQSPAPQLPACLKNRAGRVGPAVRFAQGSGARQRTKANWGGGATSCPKRCMSRRRERGASFWQRKPWKRHCAQSQSRAQRPRGRGRKKPTPSLHTPTRLVVGQLADAGPDLLVGRAHDLENLVQLVYLLQ